MNLEFMLPDIYNSNANLRDENMNFKYYAKNFINII